MIRVLLIFYYRLLGRNAVQARWLVDQKLSREDKREKRGADNRFICDCGQLMVRGDRRCPRCEQLHWLPWPLRRFSQWSGWSHPEQVTGTRLAAALCFFGYGIQVSYGYGGFLNPSPHPLELVLLGAVTPPPVTSLGDEPWRLFTYTILHGGLMHIAFNLIALAQIGPIIERTFGSARFFFSWVLAGAGAIILPRLFGFGGHLVVGASGSVFGLIGMAMAYGHRLQTPRGLYVRNKMIEWTVICTLFGFMMGNVAHSAHFGGLAAGAALSVLLPPPEKALQRSITPILSIMSLSLITYAIYRAAEYFLETRGGFESIIERSF